MATAAPSSTEVQTVQIKDNAKMSQCPFSGFSINKRPMDDTSDSEEVNQEIILMDSTSNDDTDQEDPSKDQGTRPKPASLTSSASGSSASKEMDPLHDDDDEKEAKRKYSDSSCDDGPPHIAYNILTEYQEKQLYGKYYLIRRDIISALEDEGHDDGSWGPILVRLAWHASGTFDKSDGSGGCNGATMRFHPEQDDPENKGLEKARLKLEAIKKKYDDQITYADLWIFASYIAIEAMGGPYIRFAAGRSDEKKKSLCPAHGRLPDAEGDGKHIRAIFNRMGFNDREIVALIGGGHVLGRCHPESSGYEGPWVDNPIKFSNEYFEELFENDWEEKTIESTGKRQWKDEGDELMMLRTDMMMIWDEGFLKWSKVYYKDNDRFIDDFATAYKKLTELGCPDLKNV